MAKKNKKLGKGGYFIIGMLATALLALGGFAGYEAYENAQKSASESYTTSQNSDSSGGASVANENGIKANVKTFLDANNLLTYQVNYTVSPTDYTGKTDAKIEWSDASVTEKMTDYLTFVKDNAKVMITCLQAFTDQAKLTIFSVDTPTVNAVVTLDYSTRLSIDSMYKPTISVQADDLAVAYTSLISNGSIPLNNISVETESAVWDNDFVGMFGGIGAGEGTGVTYEMQTALPTLTVTLKDAQTPHLKDIVLGTSSITADFLRQTTVKTTNPEYGETTQKLRDLDKWQLDQVLAYPIIDVDFVVNIDGAFFTNTQFHQTTEEMVVKVYASPDYVAEPISAITAGSSSYVF